MSEQGPNPSINTDASAESHCLFIRVARLGDGAIFNEAVLEPLPQL
ncbi:MAG: hypothetical protein WCY67_00595 [Acidithiobacillus sp.]